MTICSRVETISISEIELPKGRRDIRPEAVGDLARSMQQIGLLSPIGVRVVDGKARLVYGGHRLEAARKLGWDTIDCHLIEADDRQARMAEIAENLHRAELTALERSEQVAEWLRLEEEHATEKAGQVDRLSATVGGRGKTGGISEAAREIGIDRSTARRARKIGTLPPEAKAAAQELGLDDNQSALLRAAKSAQPVASLQQHAAHRVAGAGKRSQTTRSPVSPDAQHAERLAEHSDRAALCVQAIGLLASACSRSLTTVRVDPADVVRHLRDGKDDIAGVITWLREVEELKSLGAAGFDRGVAA